MGSIIVASEPYIFWKGDGCQEIIDEINIPNELGYLEPALPKYNGPSGITLDKQFLKPLGFSRKESWLCDLLPYSRINPNQRKALSNHYDPIVARYNLPVWTIPNFTIIELKNQKSRHIEILNEIEESKSKIIILLGDLPIKYWLSHFTNYKKLLDFGDTAQDYGRLHLVRINGQDYKILPLVHPRQAGALGKSSKKWNELHKNWTTIKHEL